MEKQRIAAILPAGKIFDRTFTEAILPVAISLDTELTRASTDLHQLPTTLETIKSAQNIIVDLTGLNPHVMFFTGCARALDKPIHFLTQHAETFPFKTETPLVYAAHLEQLRTDLLTALSKQTNETSSNSTHDPRAKFLAVFGDLLQKHRHEHRGAVLQDEPSVFTLLEQDMDLPLVQDIARRARELGIRVRLM